MAKPVGPPRPIPTAHTKIPTPIGSIFSEYFAIPRTDDKKTKVSNASTKKFLERFRIFGFVENIFRIATESTTFSLALK